MRLVQLLEPLGEIALDTMSLHDISNINDSNSNNYIHEIILLIIINMIIILIIIVLLIIAIRRRKSKNDNNKSLWHATAEGNRRAQAEITSGIGVLLKLQT